MGSVPKESQTVWWDLQHLVMKSTMIELWRCRLCWHREQRSSWSTPSTVCMCSNEGNMPYYSQCSVFFGVSHPCIHDLLMTHVGQSWLGPLQSMVIASDHECGFNNKLRDNYI
jgi:hypothetical protein